MARADVQRRELLATLSELSDEQWRAETMCAGWDAEDLVAHLVVREREPFAAAGVVFGGPVAAYHGRRMLARKARGRSRLLRELAAGPPWWMTAGPLEVAQAVEDWIHHEDVRRGDAGLQPRSTDAAMAAPLWQAALRFGRATLAQAELGDGRGDGAVVRLTDGDRVQGFCIGGARLARRTDGAPDVTITGPTGELALFVTGRRHAEVTLTGDDAVRTAVLSARRNV